MVVAADATSQHAVNQALATIESCEIVLMVLNKASRTDVGTYYGYYANDEPQLAREVVGCSGRRVAVPVNVPRSATPDARRRGSAHAVAADRPRDDGVDRSRRRSGISSRRSPSEFDAHR